MRSDEQWDEAAASMLAKRVKRARRALKAAPDFDVEGVHALRTAIRKVRTALEIVDEAAGRPVFPAKTVRRVEALFAALGGLRDVDVLAAHVAGLERAAALRADPLDGLARSLRRARQRQRRALAARVRRHPPADLLRALKRALKRERTDASAGDAPAHALVRHHAGGVLLKRFEAVLAFEVAEPMTPKVLHRLRVAAKRLHDALGLFDDAITAETGAIEALLSDALDLLGQLHDHVVLEEFLADFAPKPPASIAQLRTASSEDTARLRAKFDGVWRDLRAPGFRRAMAAVVEGFAATQPGVVRGARRASPGVDGRPDENSVAW